jgi:hypothetical protein
MMLFDKLSAHIGGLIQIKTELYWYDSESYDNIQNRVCLIADVTRRAGRHEGKECAARTLTFKASDVFALLLIDDSLKWIRLCENDVELIR